MQYDITHVNGCERTTVSPDLPPDHAKGDRITIRCPACGRVGECEVRAALTGLEDD